jgi:hypothetical protein
MASALYLLWKRLPKAGLIDHSQGFCLNLSSFFLVTQRHCYVNQLKDLLDKYIFDGSLKKSSGCKIGTS